MCGAAYSKWNYEGKMEDYRELLHTKASSRLPEESKQPNQIYVGILLHNINLGSCNKDNFLWLKAKRTSTAGKVRGAHSGRLEIGTDVLLVDGTEIVKDDAQIQDFDYFKTGVVVFWTVEDNWTGLLKVECAKGRERGTPMSQVDKRVPLKDASQSKENIQRTDFASFERKSRRPIPQVMRPTLRTVGTGSNLHETHATKVPESPPTTLKGWEDSLKDLNKKYPHVLSEVEETSVGLQIRCVDCPGIPFLVPCGESLTTTIFRFSTHLDNEYHKKRLKKRVKLLQEVKQKMGRGVHIPLAVTGTQIPRIVCNLCPGWKYNIGFGDHITTLLSAVQMHRRCPEHIQEFTDVYAEGVAANAIKSSSLPFEWKKEYQEGMLSRIQGRYPDSDLVLEVGGVSGALVRCRDCNVNFHLFPESEVDFSTTLAKTEAHFATPRHKLRANKRIMLEGEKALAMQKPPQRKKRPTSGSCLDELISNLRHKHPTHAFQVHEVPRSLELKVICVKCPKFVYESFAEDGVTIASTVLDSHMKMHATRKGQKA